MQTPQPAACTRSYSYVQQIDEPRRIKAQRRPIGWGVWVSHLIVSSRHAGNRVGQSRSRWGREVRRRQGTRDSQAPRDERKLADPRGAPGLALGIRSTRMLVSIVGRHAREAAGRRRRGTGRVSVSRDGWRRAASAEGRVPGQTRHACSPFGGAGGGAADVPCTQ